MGVSPETEPTEHTPPPEPETIGGLEDPRIIHPSPEDVVPDPVEPPDFDEQPSAPNEEQPAEKAGTGIVDPRIDRIGPDL